MSNYNCPRCNSDHVQRISMVYEAGVSVIDTKTTIAGGGFGGGALGLGGAKGRTTGTQISAQAAKVAPPAKKKPIRTFCVAIVASWVAAALVGGWMGNVVAAAGFGLACYLAYTMFQYNGGTWRELFERWSGRFLCHKCGEQFEPAAL